MIFMHFLAPFIVQHLKKILEVDPELWQYVIFGPKIAYLPGKKFFFQNPINKLYFTFTTNFDFLLK